MNTSPPVPVSDPETIRELVRERYAAIAAAPDGGSAACGCSPGCCTTANPNASTALDYDPGDVAALPDGADLGLGCGHPTALAGIRPGETVVDLGSGGGIDCFLAARAVGPAGRVIGVDMTPAMVTRARRAATRGAWANVEFRLGEIEYLPIANSVADLVISNCVLNLSPDQARAYAEAYRILKPGGRLAIADIVALQPLPADLRADASALVGCIAGAAVVEDVQRHLAAAGFADITIRPRPGSREQLEAWLPGRNAGEFLASAEITATKPWTGQGARPPVAWSNG